VIVSIIGHGMLVGSLMVSRTEKAFRGTALTAAALTAVMGLALPAFTASLPDYLHIRRPHPHPPVTLTQCEQAGGLAEARTHERVICIGGADNGDPVVGQ